MVPSDSHIVFTGHGEGGKSEASKIFCRLTGLKLIGSSSWHMRHYIAHELGIPVETAWETRRQRREEWRTLYRKYIENDKSRIIREMFANGNVIEGLRSRDEFEAAKQAGLFDLVIWVDCPWVKKDITQDLRAEDADLILHNDQKGLEHLEVKIRTIIDLWPQPTRKI
jgi:hypothetical protein